MSIRFKKTPLQKRLSGRAPFAPVKPAPERPPLPATGADRLAALHAAGLSVADDDGSAAYSGRTEEELQR